MKLKYHILARLSALFLGCIAVIVIPIYLSFQNGQDAYDQTKSYMIQTELNVAAMRHGRINELFASKYGQVVTDLNTLVNQTLNYLYHIQPVMQYYTTYYGDPSIDTRPAPTLDYYNQQLFSSTFQYGISSMNQLNTVPWINETSLQDDVFSSVYKAGAGLYVHVLAGTTSTGLLRLYPYSNLASLASLQYVCTNGSNAAMNYYDPRCRVWYTQVSTTGTANAVFTAPYVDATLGTYLMSASSPVYYSSGNSGSFSLWGVVCVDFNMATFDNYVNTISVTPNGYLTIMDVSGNVVSSKKWNRNGNNANANTNPTIQQLEPNVPNSVWSTILSLSSSSPPLSPQFIKTQSTLTDSSWYVFYSFIPVSQQWLIMMVPESDLFSVVDAFLSSIEAQTNNGVIGISISCVAMFIVIVLFALHEAHEATRPIESMSKMVDAMTNNNLEVEMGEKAPLSAELNVMQNNLNNLLVAVKFGNKHYFSGDNKKALECFDNAEKLMVQLKKQFGLGVCYNNKGGVYRKMQNWSESLRYYQMSIDIATKLKADVEKQLFQADQSNAAVDPRIQELHQQKRGHEIALANRIMNLGVLFQDQGQTSRAEAQFETSLNLHRRADNSLGIAKVSINLSLLYLKRKEFKQAEEILLDSKSILEKGKSAGESQSDQIWRQYTLMHLGQLYKKWSSHVKKGAESIKQQQQHNNYKDEIKEGRRDNNASSWEYFRDCAIDHCLHALQDFEHIDAEVQSTCMRLVLTMLKNRGSQKDQELVARLTKLWDQLPQSKTHFSVRHVTFLLDISGSMAGSRLKTSRSSINDIVENILKDEDTIQIRAFNEQFFTVFPIVYGNNKKAGNERIIAGTLENLDAGGGTRFYDCLLDTLDDFKSSGDVSGSISSSSTIVALTDGEDRDSTKDAVEKLLKILPKKHVNLIIITVGQLQTAKTIAELCATRETSAGTKGIHISAESGDARGIRQAFEQAKRFLIGQVNMEQL